MEVFMTVADEGWQQRYFAASVSQPFLATVFRRLKTSDAVLQALATEGSIDMLFVFQVLSTYVNDYDRGVNQSWFGRARGIPCQANDGMGRTT